MTNGGYFKIRASKDALGKGVMKILTKMFGSALEIEHVSLSVKMKKAPTTKDIDRISELFTTAGIDVDKVEAKWIDVTAK